MTTHKKMTDLGTVIVMEVKIGIIVREMVMVILEIEDKAEKILEVTCMVKVEEEVDLTKVQMLDILG